MNGNPTFREIAEDKGLLIGAAIDEDSFDNSEYQEFLSTNFNCLYPSWSFKWDCLHNVADRFDFDWADRLVDFALGKGCKVRLNCLLWHRDLPAWLADLDPAQHIARGIVAEHIEKVMSHFNGRIHYCDVVNEAIGDNGVPRPNGFSRHLGDGWIEWAFREAKNSAPDVELFYCDYRLKSEAKWNTIHVMINDLLEKKTPIDGLAVQLHSRLFPALSQKQIAHHLAKLAPLNLKLHLPECGVWIPPHIGSEVLQASIYSGMVRAGMRSSAELIGFWWPTDWRTKAKNWLDFQGNPARPGLYGLDMGEKEAARQVRQSLIQTPYPLDEK